jgi:copper chaperone
MERTLNVRGMTCGHCKASVTEALRKLPGVASVDVDLPSGRVKVVFDEQRVAVPQLREAVEAIGFDVV